MYYNQILYDKSITQVNATYMHLYDLESEWPAHNQGKTLGWQLEKKPNNFTNK